MKLIKYSAYDIPYLDISKYEFDVELVNLMPQIITSQYNVIILDKYNDVITVAMDNPTMMIITEIQKLTNYKVTVFIADKEEIREKIKFFKYNSETVLV